MVLSTLLEMQGRQTNRSCTMHIFLRLKIHWKTALITFGTGLILSQLLSIHIINTNVQMPQFLEPKVDLVSVFRNENVRKSKISNTSHLNLNISKETGRRPQNVSLIKSKSTEASLNTQDIINLYQSKANRFRQLFDCPAMFNGSETEIQKVQNFLKGDRPTGGYPLTNPGVLNFMFYDCQAYRKIRGYALSSRSQMEKEFPLAYVILVHQDFDHLERLFRIIYRPQHAFCIHLDRKASEYIPPDLKRPSFSTTAWSADGGWAENNVQFCNSNIDLLDGGPTLYQLSKQENLRDSVESLVSCFDNVVLASESHNVTYATSSRLMADYTCMKDLVNADMPWKYLMNMAATSLPLQTNMEIVKHLKSLNGANDITMRYAGRIPRRWDVEYFIGNDGNIWPSKKKKDPPPHNITVIKGMAYNTYSREFLQWVVNDKRAQDLLTWSNDTFSPDEHYWATLNDLYHNPHLKSPGGHKGHPDKYRDSTFIAKFNRNGQKCRGRDIHRVCLLVSGELQFLQKHAWYRTANKFDLLYDPVAYSCLEEAIDNRTAIDYIRH